MEPTYVFENGKVYTMVDGRVVSAIKEADFTGESLPPNAQNPGHEPVEMPDPPQDIQDDIAGMDNSACPECSSPCEVGDQFCSQCGAACGGGGVEGPEAELGPDAEPYGAFPPDGAAPLQQPALAKTVTTPNGLTGVVLGKTQGLWGDEVTVRFENGRIVRLPVSDGLKFTAAKRPVETDPVVRLRKRVDAKADGSADGLKARAKALEGIKTEAVGLIHKGATFEQEKALDQIRLEADHELGEVAAALEHLADAEAYAPPAPFQTQVVEQESVGGGDSGWLDHTVNEMIAEAESTDYEQLMDEGPEAFVAELDTPALADAGVTRNMASRWIQSRTAGADESIRSRYEQVWLSRVEEVRRNELANRKTTTHKEAASQETDYSNLPDDVLFS